MGYNAKGNGQQGFPKKQLKIPSFQSCFNI